MSDHLGGLVRGFSITPDQDKKQSVNRLGESGFVAMQLTAVVAAHLTDNERVFPSARVTHNQKAPLIDRWASGDIPAIDGAL